MTNIKSSDSGMISKDIYALFSPDDKSSVLTAIDQLVSEEKVAKGKKGSYSHFIAT